MKISHTYTIVAAGEFAKSNNWRKAREQIINSIEGVYWPLEQEKFIIQPEINGNGVSPITEQFETNLDTMNGWSSTGRKHFKSVLDDYGRLEDAIDHLSEYYETPEEIISSPWFDGSKIVKQDGKQHLVAVEWETGNISSSHRSLNRITLGLVTGVLSAGVVILPTRKLYQYLTDRVGNYPELEPYFMIWERLVSELEEGVIEIIAVEHDETGDVPTIGKLTDGLADRIESEVGGFDVEDQPGLSDY